MNILLIGNGFDLAHGLPTQYKNFLDFCIKAKVIFISIDGRESNLYYDEYLRDWDINSKIKESLMEAYKSRNRKLFDDGTYHDEFTTSNDALNKLYPLINKNVWIEYFSECPSYIGENWIDFETEISRVIQTIDVARDYIVQHKDIMDIPRDMQGILMGIIKKSKGNLKDICGSIEHIDRFTGRLYKDLKSLVRALEIYLTEFVEKINNDVVISEINELKIDHVLSFNYTNTFEKKYGIGKSIEYNFIHGEAKESNTIESNNMVLGIDEYLPEDRKDKETYFIGFKKYYQRILKSTGCDYVDWIDSIKDAYEEACYKAAGFSGKMGNNSRKARPTDFHCSSNLYIFGHSLDITDGDILRALICNDNVNTKIFYYREKKDDKRTLEKLISNLVRVIDQDELIKRTGGEFKTIEFIPQSVQDNNEAK
ncbi:hypothetical protein DW025_03035 [Coprococcus sp. AF38-1]|uniref:AbiH family protein n=1 Tax=Coprococcus sp. AF38-1 TaxID=2302943 RepID=UPI000E76CBEB|nr:AbiH family protein [Coprococcus sp. AF38-1]RJW76476.1 hypothetical protein DW025_03035 [Coprococcus sp. AF38-1]